MSTDPKASSPLIDKTRCHGCGLCVRVCPARALTLRDDQAHLSGVCALACDHCAAVCPQEAITVAITPREPFIFSTFTTPSAAPTSRISPAQLAAFLRQRRSCRNFRPAPLSRETLADLIRMGITAPSGTNSQKWTFAVIDSRERLLLFGNRIAAFYRKLNRLAEKKWLRRLLRLSGRPELERYYRNYHDSIEEALRQWREEKEDRLFHGAPAAILIGARPEAGCPQEDALLAAQNILLAAESLGLGSCLIGFAVEALRRDRSLKKSLRLPEDEEIYAVIALGEPAIAYRRPAGRRRAEIRWLP
ncbi:MAG: nitroreductase family protein [Deltaproteobacteria bacterium]|nr:nitroreductase family protein [Deltaproteobacteria bacterium]